MASRRLTQSTLARNIGVSHSAISGWLNNPRARPSAASCGELARVLLVPLDEVYQRAGYPVDRMGEEGADYQYREIDPRVIALARTLDPRMLDLWLEFGEVMARAESRP